MTTFSLSFSGDAKSAVDGLGSKDGRGCGDHDEPYRFGRRPRAIAPFPFTPYQYARILALRGCVSDGLLGVDDREAPHQAPRCEEPDSARPPMPGCGECNTPLAAVCANCVRDLAADAVLRLAGVLDEPSIETQPA